MFKKFLDLFTPQEIVGGVTFLLFVMALIYCLIALTSCNTISLNCLHTQGTASDVVDEQQSQTPTATVSPNLSVPASVIP